MRVPVEATFRRLLEQEDTDGDRQITVKDRGPRRFVLEGHGARQVEGTYALSNLLQELALAREAGKGELTLDLDRLRENPVRRISRRIREEFWDGLTRRIDAEGLARVALDTKAASQPRLYVPASDPEGFGHFSRIARERPELNLEVVRLPERITPEYVLSINDRPGLLSLVPGLPFVVPGGRFNELYGWDSYFEALGLLHDGRLDLAKAMVEHFLYEIRHYGQILNANRSYYLTRSQPPFLTSMGLAVHAHMAPGPERDAWLRAVADAAIREYRTVWTGERRLTPTGLSRYNGGGIGMPPETEPGHFDAVLAPYAAAAGLELRAYADRYAKRLLAQPALDEYFVHDRTVRESGHDTSNRLEGRAANLCTVDLNALLFRYERDIGRLLDSDEWRARAERRRALVNELCWDETRGMFFDYDFVARRRTGYESVTTLHPLWAGLASPEQARRLVEEALPLFEEAGGLVSCTEASRGPVSPERPQRQWDYPFGWPPHQMLAWQGLLDYGYGEVAQRLAYRWLLMIATNAADYNGTVPEKYDVVNRTHQVFAEYGNVGTEFDYITKEGFGWMNASYQVGLSLLTPEQRSRLEGLEPL
ncbi:MAG TPA: trehalase family glycosidase [Vicinamibacteria bacterium]|nr:trehalase family glycosidase [Vicinamibacteria bacterium]